MHFIDKLISLSLLYFENVGQFVIMECNGMNVILQKYRTEEGRGDKKSVRQFEFVPMLVFSSPPPPLLSLCFFVPFVFLLH